MWFRKKKADVKSAFPKQEEFSYEDVPKYFNSVTEKSLRNIKNYCAQTIRQKYDGEYAPNTLLAMLKTIDGEFEQAYAMLDADYNTRLRGLQIAYQQGLADIQKDLIDFRLHAIAHDNAFHDYNEIHQALTGRELPTDLLYAGSRLGELEHQYKSLQKEEK